MLANDTGYENIYAHQLLVKAKPNDILIVLSGSGNSPNVVKAIETAIKLGVKSYAIVALMAVNASLLLINASISK